MNSGPVLSFGELMQRVKGCPPKVVAVAAAHDEEILQVAHMAGQEGLARFVLAGDLERMEQLREAGGYSLDHCQMVHIPHEGESARHVIGLVREGKADLPMKGLLPTSTFMRAVLDKESGLNKGSLLSEVSVMEKPGEPGLLFLTDCAINMNPDLEAKKSILQNAVDLAQRLGYGIPKVACVTALELVNPAMQDTLDAAALSKMNQRGQITGCVVDGPLALDNAISARSAQHKGVDSLVAGKADILLMSDIRMGNVLHKAATYLAGKPVACAVVGAALPVVMTSRSDSPGDKLLSIALACVLGR